MLCELNQSTIEGDEVYLLVRRVECYCWIFYSWRLGSSIKEKSFAFFSCGIICAEGKTERKELLFRSSRRCWLPTFFSFRSVWKWHEYQILYPTTQKESTDIWETHTHKADQNHKNSNFSTNQWNSKYQDH